MAEDQTVVQEQGQLADGAPTDSAAAPAEPEFQYDIKIEQSGPSAKKVTVQIPESRIADKLKEQFQDLRKEATIPGFRPGHAPQKLVEKKFASDVREQVRRSLISESYHQAVEKHSLSVIGEPEFENLQDVKLPETGDLTYSFSVEVEPELTLPPLEGLKVRKPKVEVTDLHIDQAMNNLRAQNGGALVPVEDRGLEADDHAFAEIRLRKDDKIVGEMRDVRMVVRPGPLGGFQISDLVEKLAGMKPGEKRSFDVHVPADHALESIRDQDVQLEFELKDIKRLELPEVDKPFLEELGFNDVQELRDALKEQLVERINYDVQEYIRQQVSEYLLQNVQVEIPERMSNRQTTRIAGRRAAEMQMRGMSEEQVMANLKNMQAGDQQAAARELKLFFIHQKLAKQEEIEVPEAELNSAVALIAVRQGRRPEKVKHEMANDGRLAQLYVLLREQKALDKVLEKAQFEEFEPSGDAGVPPVSAATAAQAGDSGAPAPASPAESSSST
jgi:trigger factor